MSIPQQNGHTPENESFPKAGFLADFEQFSRIIDTRWRWFIKALIIIGFFGFASPEKAFPASLLVLSIGRAAAIQAMITAYKNPKNPPETE